MLCLNNTLYCVKSIFVSQKSQKERPDTCVKLRQGIKLFHCRKLGRIYLIITILASQDPSYTINTKSNEAELSAAASIQRVISTRFLLLNQLYGASNDDAHFSLFLPSLLLTSCRGDTCLVFQAQASILGNNAFRFGRYMFPYETKHTGYGHKGQDNKWDLGQF
jgi:hypothetical protein